MNWFASALPWYGWAILACVPPLILMLYFLKLRRTPVEVPSTYLWTKTIEDLHVNSIWQRLRNSLLLLLQLLLAFLLLLACLQPGCEGENLVGDRFIFLLDQSASMSATDMANGKSRLENAKTEIRNMIDSMEANASAMIISFSNESDVVQSYTKNKSQLKQKLAAVRQTQQSSDMTEALTAASGLANPGRTSDRTSAIDIQVADALKAKLFIFSDGGVSKVPDFSFGNLEAEYRPVGALEIPHNVGVTAFSISQDVDTESGVQAFVRLQNSDDQGHSVGVTMLADGEVFDAKGSVAVPQENSTVMSFDLTPLLADFSDPIQVEVRIDNEDVYMQDNVAYGVIEPPRKINALVITESNNFLRLAMGTERIKKLVNVTFEPPQHLQSKEYTEAASLGAYDLMIFDRCAPEKMPESNTLFIGAVPPDESWSLGEKQFPTTIIDTLSTHPMLNAVSMATVTIVEGGALSGPQGTISLMDSTYGSVMAIAPRAGFQDVVVGFSLIEFDDDANTVINTDWPNKLSFPLFIQNSLTWLGGASKFNSTSGTRPGELVRLRTRVPAESITVKDPSGRTTSLKPRKDKTFVYAAADQAGSYSVTNSTTQELDQLHAVNLLDTLESNLAVLDELNVGYEEVPKSVESVPARREYWTWVILAALLVLVIEWYIYNQRVLI